MMTLRSDIIPYRDSCGLILPKKWTNTPRESQNGLLYLGIFYLLLDDITMEDRIKFAEVVQSCWEIPGVLNRNPGQNDNLEAHDDYLGICAAAYKLNSSIADNIYLWGKSHNWSYNNITPYRWTFRTWFARMPSNVTHITRCVKRSNNIILEILDILTTIIGSRNPGDNILTWVRLNVTKGWYWNIIKRIWMMRIKNKYGSIRNLFTEYFGLGHPFNEAVKETFPIDQETSN